MGGWVDLLPDYLLLPKAPQAQVPLLFVRPVRPGKPHTRAGPAVKPLRPRLCRVFGVGAGRRRFSSSLRCRLPLPCTISSSSSSVNLTVAMTTRPPGSCWRWEGGLCHTRAGGFTEEEDRDLRRGNQGPGSEAWSGGSGYLTSRTRAANEGISCHLRQKWDVSNVGSEEGRGMWAWS